MWGEGGGSAAERHVLGGRGRGTHGRSTYAEGPGETRRGWRGDEAGRRSTRGVVLTNTGERVAGREKRPGRGTKGSGGKRLEENTSLAVCVRAAVWLSVLSRFAVQSESQPARCPLTKGKQSHTQVTPRPALGARCSAGCSLRCTSTTGSRKTFRAGMSWRADGGRRTRRKRRSARRLTVRRNDSRPSPRSRS